MRGTIIFFLVIACFMARGQGNVADSLYKSGLELITLGDYTGAIERFEGALKFKRHDPEILYSLSLVHYTLGNFGEAKNSCSISMNQPSGKQEQAIVLYGAILAETDDLKASLKFYRKSCKRLPASYLLAYNLALTEFNLEMYDDARISLEHVLRVNSGYPPAHLLLGHVMSKLGFRARALMSWYYFLLLEPKSPEAPMVVKLIKDQYFGLAQNADSNKNDFHDPAFEDAEMAIDIGVLYARSNHLVGYSYLVAINQSFFHTLGAGPMVKGLWGEIYLKFFNGVEANGHTETFTYYTFQVDNNAVFTEWAIHNGGALDKFANFLGSY